MTTQIKLALALKPNTGWTVQIYINDEYEGPTHDGHFPNKQLAHEEAERVAAQYPYEQGFDTSILGRETVY
jgi:hypothetical protein